MSVKKVCVSSAVLTFLTLLSFLILSSSYVSADNDTVVDEINITVPASCTLSGLGMDSHATTLNNGTYASDIGTTTIKAFCNDQEGFAIYAIGYTDNTDGKNVMSSPALGSTHDIATGTSLSGNNSQWAMKLSTTTNPEPTYPITIQNNYNNYHTIPNEYELVAKRTAATDTGTNAIGSVLTSTYQIYVSSTQTAGTYVGQVKYTMVHPASAKAPVPVSENLYYAITGSANNYTLTISDSDISDGAVASGPVAINGYIYDEDNRSTTSPWSPYSYQIKSVVVEGTVAPTSTSAWFAEQHECNSWDLSGLRTDHVTDMSRMFDHAGSNAAAFSLDLSSWDTSNVTDMSYMFNVTGYSATNFSLNLSSWDTSNVTDMSHMFNVTGASATNFSLDLSSWDTSNVTDMSYMFADAGASGTTFSLDLSSWDTSNVTNMSGMFQFAGSETVTNFSLNLSSWDTSNVTNMSSMFESAGHPATNFSLNLSSWDNTSNVTDMSRMFLNTGYSATTFSLNLSSWDTSNVTDMNRMFVDTGHSATNFSLNLSSWDTSNVTDMSYMFYDTGYSATNWSIIISPTNNGTTTGGISNTTSRLYGKTSSVYGASPQGSSTRSFTVGA